MEPKIIDCTLRDGGHLIEWKFSFECGKASYYAAIKSGVDFFEIGYRYPPTKKDLGEFGYCRDDFLLSLIKPSEKCKLLCMIDAGKCESSLFNECSPEITPLKGVRVAAYPYELKKALDLVEDLKKKKYEVFLNLMAYSAISPMQFKILEEWDKKDILSGVYFADSFGSFLPSEIPKHYALLKNIGFKRIGFHPHNNLQLAFANTLMAIDSGAQYVDASIFGMGRGAGNLPIEVLLGYFEKRGNKKYNTVSYLDVIERYYLSLYKEHDWGYKLTSLLSGLKNIHPYYVEELVKKRNYTIEEIWNSLDTINEKCPISFSADKMNEALEARFYTPLGEKKAGEFLQVIYDQFKIIPAKDAFRVNDLEVYQKHKGRKFLIIGTGPSIIKYKNTIEEFCRKENCITIGMNFLQGAYIPDYHIFVSRKRFAKYITTINKESQLLVPTFFGKKFIEENYAGKCVYFDVETVENYQTSPIDGNKQVSINLNVGVSAILIAYLMGASEIYVIGMDGYINEQNKEPVYFYNENDVPDSREVSSIRYEKLQAELARVNNFLQKNGILFSIITPTSHKKYYNNILNL